VRAEVTQQVSPGREEAEEHQLVGEHGPGVGDQPHVVLVAGGQNFVQVRAVVLIS